MSALSRFLVTFATAQRLALRAPLALLVPVLLCASQPHAAGLNDTGITDCWNDTGVAASSVAADTGTHPRQDCRYGRDAAAVAGSLPKVGGGSAGFDFTKIANNGSALSATAVSVVPVVPAVPAVPASVDASQEASCVVVDPVLMPMKGGCGALQ